MQKRRGEAARPGKRRRKSEHRQWRRVSAITVAGVALVGLFAVAGYQLGSVAVARSVVPLELDLALVPAPGALRKGSLFAATPLVEPTDVSAELAAAERPVPASLVPASLVSASLVSAKSDTFTKSRKAQRSDRLLRLISPPVALIEKTWRRGREQRGQFAEHTCLAQAIYFEARSESELGRLAVAKVILNRVKSPFFPDTICEVVYQNAEKSNACQFSFACNGKSDRPRRGKAWEQAKTLATRSIAGEGDVQATATATYFHADYVQPKWSGAMTRLVKIGRHIFYSGS